MTVHAKNAYQMAIN